MIRGHIVAVTVLTGSCFANVHAFCHARNICGEHKFWILDNTFFRNISSVRAARRGVARNNVAKLCRGRQLRGIESSAATLMCPSFAWSLGGQCPGTYAEDSTESVLNHETRTWKILENFVPHLPTEFAKGAYKCATAWRRALLHVSPWTTAEGR